MLESLRWLYLINAVLLIVHEIDSAYWKEWELFRLPGGPGFFMVLHVPLLGLALYGLLLIDRGSAAGLPFSLILSLAGMAAFGIHTYFIRKGRPEFKTRISLAILWGTLLVSLAQGVLTVISGLVLG